VDATLVRCVLVPATMTMLGKANWYLPKWLNWIPNVSLGETDEEPEGIKIAPAPRLPRGLVPAPVPVSTGEPEIIERKY
jgi:putative drug exporter of the RND superfamily